MASLGSSTKHTKKNLYLPFSSYSKKLKKEHSQIHSMRPPSPWYQNQTKMPQTEKTTALDNSVVPFLVSLKSVLSDMSINTPAYFWFPFAWTIFFQPLTFNLCVSLGLRWVSCRQHIYRGFGFVSLFLLVGTCSPFTFRIIIDMYLITTYFTVSGLFL